VRTEFRLWEWPFGEYFGKRRDLYPTVGDAMDAAPGGRSDWRESANGGWYIPLPDGDRTGRYQSHAVVPERVPESIDDRVELAIEVLLENGQVDGDHHKMWTIDQALRCLLGDDYEATIAGYCDGEDGPETYEWDTGIAP
jgi:hypothetical protein